MKNDIATAGTIVEIRNLSRKFGSTAALSDIGLQVPRGVVFGLVGANGAGKTTLIRHIMGLLRAELGVVSVFGMNPASNPSSVLSRVGYMSEASELPEWMRVHELIRFTRSFYPNWDDTYADSLRQTFELDDTKTVQSLSKGQRARLALLLAVAHRPELLVLDEPSSGLDPLVRRDILRAIIRTISDEGRTVLFSSHLLDEVERVADHVAIIEHGHIIQNDSLDALKGRFHQAVFHFGATRTAPPRAEPFFNWQGGGRRWSATFQGNAEEAERLSARFDAEVVELATPSLNEIFVALVGARKRQPA
jgi:ABC-2 type transport system ATP-binding protein